MYVLVYLYTLVSNIYMKRVRGLVYTLAAGKRFFFSGGRFMVNNLGFCFVTLEPPILHVFYWRLESGSVRSRAMASSYLIMWYGLAYSSFLLPAVRKENQRRTFSPAISNMRYEFDDRRHLPEIEWSIFFGRD